MGFAIVLSILQMWDLALGLRKDESLTRGTQPGSHMAGISSLVCGTLAHACNHEAMEPPLRGCCDMPLTFSAGPGSGTKHLGQGGPSGPLGSQGEARGGWDSPSSPTGSRDPSEGGPCGS